MFDTHTESLSDPFIGDCNGEALSVARSGPGFSAANGNPGVHCELSIDARKLFVSVAINYQLPGASSLQLSS